MRRATILAGLSVLLASPVLAQVCQDPIVLQSEVGRALTWEEGNQDLTQIRLLCSASIEDFPTELADGCLLGASGGAIECTSAGAGTVTSVALSPPSGILAVSGSPVTTTGTLTLSASSVAANLVAAGPATGAASAWGFRSLVAADVPSLPYLPTSTTYAASVSVAGPASSVAADSVALTTDTTGNYVASLTCGAGLSGCGSAAEGATPTIAATLGTSIDVAELSAGTAGALITWDGAGDPASISPGTLGQILTSAGAGSPPTWEDAPAGVTDHGLLSGLSDDDHPQYSLLAGRSGGQTLYGGTGAGDDLTLAGTSNGTAGSVLIGSGELRVPASFGSSCSLCIGSSDSGIRDATGAGQLTWRGNGSDFMDFVSGLGLRLLSSGTPSIILTGQGSIGGGLGNRLFFGGGNGLAIYGEGAGGTEQLVGMVKGDFAAVSRGLGAYVPVQPSTAGSGSPLVLTTNDVGKLITNAGATSEVYVDLPTAASGFNVQLAVLDANGLRAVAATGDTIRIGASTSSSGGYCTSVTVGSTLLLVAVDADTNLAMSYTGTWLCF